MDPEWVAKPRRWDNRFIGRYMVLFGLVGFLPLPAPLMLMLIGLSALYVVVAEIVKKFF